MLDLRPQAGEPWQLLPSDLDAGATAVVADANDGEAAVVEQILRRLDRAQLAERDVLPVGDPRRQAGVGRAIPRREAESLARSRAWSPSRCRGRAADCRRRAPRSRAAPDDWGRDRTRWCRRRRWRNRAARPARAWRPCACPDRRSSGSSGCERSPDCSALRRSRSRGGRRSPKPDGAHGRARGRRASRRRR